MMAIPPQTEIDVVEIGQPLRIEYKRRGRTYVHEFGETAKIAYTHDRRHIIIYGPDFQVDNRGWLHG